MSNTLIATVGIDLGKSTFHLVGFDEHGAIRLRQKMSRSQLERRFANLRPCLVGMEACAGAHHVARRLAAYGHDARLIPAKYVKPFLKGHKNDYRDAEAIAEAVGRPTMRFVPLKSVEQLDLQALHRVRSRLVSHRGCSCLETWASTPAIPSDRTPSTYAFTPLPRYRVRSIPMSRHPADLV